MIFLKEMNILFLKPKKVAGTSFEIALSKFANINDIVTPISLEDEQTRRGLGFGGPRNYKKPISEYSAGELFRFATRGQRPNKYFNHISAKAARSALGESIFDNATKITIVRNPFDALVSMFYWQRKNLENDFSFSDWVRRNPDLINMNERQYFADGKHVIDYYIRYEKLASDIEALEHKFPGLDGLSSIISNINAKSNIRPKNQSFRDVYSSDAELVSIVRFFNKYQIDKFGYDLD